MATSDGALGRKQYETALRELQVELCALQDWIKEQGERVVVVFEGRDAAGKGGVIKAITDRVSPRVFRVVALPAPSERQRSQIYMQRFLEHFPAAGEIVIFDRSWYNRAGIEHVMGFCSKEQHQRFLKTCPEFELYAVDDGVRLIKYWLEVSEPEQKRRFEARITDPLRQWKLSPTDLCSRRLWFEYSRARDIMLEATDTGVRALVHRAVRRQTARASQLHPSPARPDPLQETAAQGGQAAQALERRHLRRPGDDRGQAVRASEVLMYMAKPE